MALAVFALVLVLGVAVAAFCAGWIFHEERERHPIEQDPPVSDDLVASAARRFIHARLEAASGDGPGRLEALIEQDYALAALTQSVADETPREAPYDQDATQALEIP